MDAISESRLALVHPVLQGRVHALANQLAARSITIRVTQALRTWSEQRALYAQGRTAPGRIVTDADAGYSAHNFGYAIDFVAMDGALPDWNASDAAWQEVLALALTCGLAEGAQWRTFPDAPHLYLAELPADPDDDMREAFLSGGIMAVWDLWRDKLVQT